MAELDVELAAYRSQIYDLESKYMGRWVIFRNAQHVGTYDTFEEAARDAVAKFGRGPYLIKQVGAPPIALPICVTANKPPDDGQVRI
jgi:hypothetical protein